MTAMNTVPATRRPTLAGQCRNARPLAPASLMVSIEEFVEEGRLRRRHLRLLLDQPVEEALRAAHGGLRAERRVRAEAVRAEARLAWT